MYFDQGQDRELISAVLCKRAQGKGKVLTAINWKERCFVLTPKTLSYFEGSAEKRGKLKGTIELATVKAVECVDYEAFERNYGFQVVYDDYTLYIVGKDEDERLRWMDAIRDEVRENKFLLMEYHSGAFLSKWTCCDGKEKLSKGCKETFIGIEKKATEAKANVLKERNWIANQPLPPLPTDSAEDSSVKPFAGEKYTEIVTAVYDFDSVEPGDLSLVKGELFAVIDRAGEHWWLAKNTRGQQGYIPSNYVRKQGLESESWFHPEMSRQMTEDALRKEGKEGCFIVRNSSREGMYTLSVLHGENVRHYHIKIDQDKLYYISDRHRFDSVPKLVHYHQHNSGGLVTRLRQPPSFGQKPSTAGFGHDKWEIDRSEITLGRELGAGQFGCVREGMWRGSLPVAVKLMKDGAMSEDDFIEEAKVMKMFQHSNLVQLYGICSEKPIYIIQELMKGGCLLHYLRKNQFKLQAVEMTEMVRQVAAAMKYLEGHNFIHRDLAARNCLIGENSNVKVADFGLARYVIDDEYTASEGTKFPIKWAAPEVILYSKFSSKSDVWAFAILAWEIFTGGKQPYPAIGNPEVVQKVINGYRLEKPQRCPDNAYGIIRECWLEEPEARPTFVTIDKWFSDLVGEDYDETDD